MSPPGTTMISTLRRTSSSISSVIPLLLAIRVRNSVQYSSPLCSQRRATLHECLGTGGNNSSRSARYPIRGIFFALRLDFRAERRSKEQEKGKLFSKSCSSRAFPISDFGSLTLSFDHLVRPRQYVGWNGQADLFRRYEVDRQFELPGLFDG